MTNRIASKHFSTLREQLMRYAEHAGLLADHGDVRGLAREGFVKVFLQTNLPQMVDFTTGEIIDSQDNRSGQIDLIIQSAVSPRFHLFDGIEVALVDCVLGAIEVKSTLTTASIDSPSHLKASLASSQQVKSLCRVQPLQAGTPKWKSDGPLFLEQSPYFVFAYSGPTKDTLLQKIEEYGKHYRLPYDHFAPNVIVVLDRNYYIYRNDGFLFPPQGSEPYRQYEGEECLVGLFVYICQLIETWNSVSHHTQFGEYFRRS